MKTTNAMKRLLSLVLSLVLLIGIMPQMVMPVSALTMEIIDVDGPQDGSFTYLDNVTILIDTDSINNLILPTTITYPYTGKTWVSTPALSRIKALRTTRITENSLSVQWLGFCTSTSVGRSLILALDPAC